MRCSSLTKLLFRSFSRNVKSHSSKPTVVSSNKVSQSAKKSSESTKLNSTQKPEKTNPTKQSTFTDSSEKASTDTIQHQTNENSSQQSESPKDAKQTSNSTSSSKQLPPMMIFDQEFHIKNQQNSISKKQLTHEILNFQGKKLDLIGLPISQQNEKQREENTQALNDIFEKTLTNEFALLGIDPSFHMSDKRALQYQLRKKFLFQGQDIDNEKALKENPTYPLGLEEVKLDLFPLDFMKSTETEKIVMMQKLADKSEEKRIEGYFTSLFTKQAPASEEERQKDEERMRELFEFLQVRIFGQNSYDTLAYPQIVEGCMIGLVARRGVFLGQVPQIYQRLYIGNHVEISLLKQLFKEVLKFAKKYNMGKAEHLGRVTPLIFSHVYSFIGDYYTYFLMQKMAQHEFCNNGITLVLKNYQIEPFKLLANHYGDKGYKQNEDFLEFLQLVENKQDNDEILLEKHAILDILFSDSLWEQSFVINPFPYLQEDFTQLSAKDQSHIAHIYSVNLKKYQSVANEFFKN